MATSAFRSTMKRGPIRKSPLSSEDDSCSSNHSSAHRRHRSLSRFSRRIPDLDFDERLVSTERGLEFPEISLDDLAVEFFDSFSNDGEGDIKRSGSGNGRRSAETQASQRRGRSVSRTRSVSNSVFSETESSRRRRSVSTRGSRDGVCVEKAHANNQSSTRRRSVSRQPSKGNANNGSAERLASQTGNSRRRRSLSVVRRQISDSESDADHFKSSSNRVNSKSYAGGNIQVTRKSAASDCGPGLSRPFTQTELKYYDGYSSQSSAMTDDERRNKRCSERGTEKIIRAVHSQKKGENPTAEDDNCGVYEAMRKELRHAVEEIRTELEQATTKSRTVRVDDDCGPQATDSLLAVSNITKSYATKLQESAKRKQELLAEMLLEEQRGRELSEIVNELLSEPNGSAVSQKPSQARQRSKDRNRSSNNLTEDAERYIEEFISNIEDNDISSLDDERSETSSNFGIRKTVTYQSPSPLLESVPVEEDGVALPWLQWETSSDSSSIRNNNMLQHTPSSSFSPWDSNSTLDGSMRYKETIRSIISDVSWRPSDSSAIKFMEPTQTLKLSDGETRFRIDVGDYLNRKSDKDVVYETWTQRHRISSGGLLFCNAKLFLL